MIYVNFFDQKIGLFDYAFSENGSLKNKQRLAKGSIFFPIFAPYFGKSDL